LKKFLESNAYTKRVIYLRLIIAFGIRETNARRNKPSKLSLFLLLLNIVLVASQIKEKASYKLDEAILLKIATNKQKHEKIILINKSPFLSIAKTNYFNAKYTFSSLLAISYNVIGLPT